MCNPTCLRQASSAAHRSAAAEPTEPSTPTTTQVTDTVGTLMNKAGKPQDERPDVMYMPFQFNVMPPQITQRVMIGRLFLSYYIVLR